jgi:flavin reductase (DIM6/NTAB) family NADH-FMN oxidoreductase RutF
MFYDTRHNEHGLPYDPFKAIVAPRPIGWITSVSVEGKVNLAPYSFFNAISSKPPIVMFSGESQKDSVRNIEETKEFVCNLVTAELAAQMNATSEAFAHGVNEMERVGLQSAPSRLVKPPRVARSPCALECRYLRSLTIDDLEGRPASAHMIFGQVIGIYIDDSYVKNGILDTAAMQPLARAGYRDYFVSTTETRLTMRRPPGGGG